MENSAPNNNLPFFLLQRTGHRLPGYVVYAKIMLPLIVVSEDFNLMLLYVMCYAGMNCFIFEKITFEPGHCFIAVQYRLTIFRW